MPDDPLVTKMSASVFFSKKSTLALYLKYIQIISESIKTKESSVSWKMFAMQFKLSHVLSIRSKVLFLGISETTKRLVGQSKAYILRNRQGKQAFDK